jgi:IS605 OrfB family transposase
VSSPSKRRSTPSCRFTTGTIRLEEDRKHVTLPVLGTLKTHENTRKLQRRLANGTAKVTSATVKWESGRRYVSFCVQVEKQDREPTRSDVVVGVDLGVRTLTVFSDGRSAVGNPRHYDTARRKLGRLSRTVSRRVGPDRRTGQRPSHRWQRADQQRNKVHHRVANLRREGIHQLTTALAREYGTIVVEDLNVSGMLRNRKLARVVSDAGFGEIRRQLTYKAAWNGGRVEVADRWFPSSKTCSGCGAVKPKLPLRMRTFVCDECGLVLDRDENAALNLAALVERQVAGSGPETRNGRGADRKTGPSPAGGRETSTSYRTSRGSDQTRTFAQ